MASGDVTRGKALLAITVNYYVAFGGKNTWKTMLTYLDFLQIRIYELIGYSKLEGLERAGLIQLTQLTANP